MRNKKQFLIGVGLSYLFFALVGVSLGEFSAFTIVWLGIVLFFSAMYCICKGAGID